MFIEGELAHSVFRVPHSQVYVDAFGAEADEAGLARKAARYVRAAESFAWRGMSTGSVPVPGERRRVLRKASPYARRLLAEADRLVGCG